MDSASLKMASSKLIVGPHVSALMCPRKSINFGCNFREAMFGSKICAASLNGSASSFTLHRTTSHRSVYIEEPRAESSPDVVWVHWSGKRIFNDIGSFICISCIFISLALFVLRVAADHFFVFQSMSSLREDENRSRSNLESLFCYDKAIPEEIIEKPVGLSLDEKEIGSNLRCTDCQAKGAVLCATCSGSGLYVDSILESQGIIVKVRCLGCGGTGNMMCTTCGGRGHCGCE